MDILNPKYTIEEGPSPMEWEKYVEVSEKEYKKLLSSESTLENDFHTFFEKTLLSYQVHLECWVSQDIYR